MCYETIRQTGEGWCGMAEPDAMRGPPGPSRRTGDAGAGWPGSAARTVTVAALLAVAVIGLRARGAFPHRASSALIGAGGSVSIEVFAAAEGAGLIACVILLALLPRRREHDAEEEQLRWRAPVQWWVKTLGVLLCLAIYLAPVVILIVERGRKAVTAPAPTRPLVPLPGTGHQVAPSQGSLMWPFVAGMIIAAVAVLVVAVRSRLRRHGDGTSRPGRVRAASLLAEGLRAGSDALAAGGEPRQAIIACYAAMERGFAAAGSAPAVADTPAEVLTRARRAGIIRSGSAEVLTGLFRRARYSSQPMTSADSGAAASALAQMRADLADSAARGSGR